VQVYIKKKEKKEDRALSTDSSKLAANLEFLIVFDGKRASVILYFQKFRLF